MRFIQQIFLVLMAAVIFIGCEAKMIRKECKKTSYEMCLRQFGDEEKRRGMTKAEFKTCWRSEYAKCCENQGIKPW